MRRIVILAALPRELKPLVRAWERRPATRPVSLWTRVDENGDELVAVCAGMGSNAARRAFAAAEALGRLDLVLSVGLAGATHAELAPGMVKVVSQIVDAQTGERFNLAAGNKGCRLATVSAAAHPAEKARLLASYRAELVDMEAATVARLAAMREIPVGCIKAVSDAFDARLPDLERFVDSEGQMRMGSFMLHLGTHPASWGMVASLAKNSQRACVALGAALTQFLAHKDWDYTGASGHFGKL